MEEIFKRILSIFKNINIKYEKTDEKQSLDLHLNDNSDGGNMSIKFDTKPSGNDNLEP